MWGRCKFLKSIAVIAILGSPAPTTFSQSKPVQSELVAMAGVRCQCGRWTCPDCQQQRLSQPCLPGQLSPQHDLPEIVVAPPNYRSPLGSPSTSGTEISPSDAGAPQQPRPPQTYNPADAGAAASASGSPAGPNASNLFASNVGGGGGGSFGSSLRGASTPEMMGDFFGPGAMPSIISNGYAYYDPDYPPTSGPVPPPSSYATPVPGGGYTLGRMKLGENSSPIPRDRIFFNYSHFTGVPLSTQPISVNRYTPGFEKTFIDGLCSFEMRTPFGTTLDNDIMASGPTSDNNFQFGNMFLTLKGVLLQHDNWVFSAGSSLLLPTAEDTRVIDPITTRELLRFDNKSTHIMPFIGGAYIPSERLFAQWIVQCDIDANGTPVKATDLTGTRKIGTLQDFTLLYTDVSLGYWVYKSGPGQRRAITGIAPLVEVHYNRSLNQADSISDPGYQINQVLADFDNVNMQTGLIFDIRNNSRLGFGYATPLGNSFDRVFDKEFRVTLNRYF